MAQMKKATSIEQSNLLVACGLSWETRDMSWYNTYTDRHVEKNYELFLADVATIKNNPYYGTDDFVPAWTASRLIEIADTVFKDFVVLEIRKDKSFYNCMLFLNIDGECMIYTSLEADLIDALFEVYVKARDNIIQS
jgi:hypothetical protein